ncbi:MAG: hypothetical protein IPP19_06530 [Verrucomicrobia bacterium]|nr:hypothetical protein [Verrucomicrobiota bacterium]
MSKRLPLIIYTHGGGRLGNQIIRWAHWIAWVRSHEGQIEVLNMAFWPYADCFQVWDDDRGCAFPKPSRLANLMVKSRAAVPTWVLSRVERRFQHLIHAAGYWCPGMHAITLDDLGGESIDLDDPVFFDRIASRSVTTCSGWKIASWRLFAEHQTELRKYFQPTAGFALRAQEFITALRQRYDVLVGMFIRQTDYQIWAGGRFYFSTMDYVQWIRQLLDLHPGRRLAIVVASDEWQDTRAFAGLPCFFATGSVNSQGYWFESFVELSLCDLIISPPSTFGAAAAFVGAVPLWPVTMAGQSLASDQILTNSMVDAARHPVFSLAVK